VAELILSTAVAIELDDVRCAEYYPSGSLQRNVATGWMPTPREEDFLIVRLSEGDVRVLGAGAAEDAHALQQAGIEVYRRRLTV
jgi:precorrin-4 methylase